MASCPNSDRTAKLIDKRSLEIIGIVIQVWRSTRADKSHLELSHAGIVGRERDPAVADPLKHRIVEAIPCGPFELALVVHLDSAVGVIVQAAVHKV